MVIYSISCKNSDKYDLKGDWQSHIGDSLYFEVSYTDDSVFLFDEFSLSLRVFEYKICNDTLRYYKRNIELNKETAPTIKKINEEKFILIQPDGVVDTYKRIDTLKEYNVYSMLNDANKFLDCFWKRRFAYLKAQGLQPTFYQLEYTNDPILDSLLGTSNPE